MRKNQTQVTETNGTMDAMEIYQSECKLYLENVEEAKTKFDWAATEIFGLVTYDSEINRFLVQKIIEVCKVILNKTAYEYILDKDNNFVYILVCQILNAKKWISWGSSIRGCWFDTADLLDHDDILYHETLTEYYYNVVAVPFSEDNLRALIDFLENDSAILIRVNG